MADIKFSQFTAGNNVRVDDIVVGLRNSDNYKFSFPGTGIEDSSGNLLLGYSSAGISAVNYVFIESGNTTFAPTISALGADTNINLDIESKGTGSVNLNGVSVNSLNSISGITTAVFTGSTSGLATLKAQAVAGTPTIQLPSTSGILALASSIPTFPVSLANGGTGASLTADNGGIFYSNATTGAILSGTATAGQLLQSGSSSAPNWTTATYPSSTTANRLLYSSAANVVGQVTGANGASLVSTNAGVPTWSNSMLDGQLIMGSTGGQPQAASVTGGAGITVSAGSNSLTISATAGGGGLAWSNVSGTSQAAAVNSGYITANSSLTTVTLPVTAALGSVIAVQGYGTGGWIIQAPGAQVVHIGSVPSSAGGAIASANQYDSITLVCVVANTAWSLYGPVTSGYTIT
jgi:hypothetical protein